MQVLRQPLIHISLPPLQSLLLLCCGSFQCCLVLPPYLPACYTPAQAIEAAITYWRYKELLYSWQNCTSSSWTPQWTLKQSWLSFSLLAKSYTFGIIFCIRLAMQFSLCSTGNGKEILHTSAVDLDARVEDTNPQGGGVFIYPVLQ